MIRYFLLLIISSSILFTQELNDKWLNTILEKNVPDMVTTPTETLNKQEEDIISNKKYQINQQNNKRILTLPFK